MFYETYPGDGRILLFHENAPQEAAVMDFFEKDVPQLFPTLQCEYFTRGTLHHVHDSQRRFRLIPENTDLCLASFDTYWINWYTEQWQRIKIWGIIKERLGSSEPVLTGFIHRLALKGRLEESYGDLAGAPALANGGRADESKLKEILALAVQHIYKSDEGTQGIFELLFWDRIRLFASRQSPIIDELLRGTHRVLHDPEGREPSAKVRSVPYNLNVGFFVCRTDLLQRRLQAMGGKRGGFKGQMRSALKDVCRYRARWTAEALKDDGDGKAIDAVVEADLKRIQVVAAWRSKQGEHLPSWTWEEIIACCQVAKCSLFIETPIFDTFLAVLLELVWAHGGQLRIAPDYDIEDWVRTKRALVQALSLLSYAFKQRIILSDWSKALDAKGDSPGEPPWLFARHWHSTLVDLLTAKDKSSRSVAWDPSGDARLSVLPVPTTGTVTCGKEGPKHISCAGDWHYAALKGSENTDLAYSLINWLVSSQQTVQEAFTSAVLPTAKSFYEIYGSAQCINVPQRTMDSLPRFTFDEARSLARNAGLRSSIFDFRRTMREMHGILEAVRAGRIEEPTRLAAVLEDARDRIVRLGTMEPGIGKG